MEKFIILLKDLDAYAKYISRNKRKKVIKVVYKVEG